MFSVLKCWIKIFTLRVFFLPLNIFWLLNFSSDLQNSWPLLYYSVDAAARFPFLFSKSPNREENTIQASHKAIVLKANALWLLKPLIYTIIYNNITNMMPMSRDIHRGEIKKVKMADSMVWPKLSSWFSWPTSQHICQWTL